MVLKRFFSIAVMVILFVSVVGCSSQETHDLNDSKLIYEEAISPNREYVENEEDIVDYTIEIYQDNENNILVYSTSNAEFFDPLQCEMEWDEKMNESDIFIEWTTLMGSQTSNQDDQFALANVSFLKDGQVVQEVKINFVDQGIEIIKEIIR
ncbi:hypothetical protein [Faecalitalea cylindroides]|uniref:hypothetical protein n=1 Tax=Faecalitalea cylindroides TaxID=39483 RepID=UPI00232CD590|nr:hypothetical protein [Faecalitalea cylindroides]MDB7953188.1 hypothetical protein [Faecalitalea cylindroides]MDB7960016.1 hypothetical protein [Faecalitalea cylindroides]MDB7961638.1 hypothetical protein [Faecalitalea cylindroides]MDB7963736.1 hypothetical protein [Faecalitalea cylindroides]MDB7965623.1 hypothetical protein [Faecalitalea cylindroides]